MEIAKAYDPKEAEEKNYQRWESLGFFAPEINGNPDAEAFSIVIPPPNVTGSLHMGHALQHTLMDVLTRWKRMQGYRTLWLPGTDHAGISVQRKVVEQLKKDEHKKPMDIGREEFVKRAWKWKELYGNTITEQMRREGASVDWTRQRFTMDESLSLAVRNVFCTLYDEGNIYRGLRIVNWCPKDKTVLSDLEVKEETSKDGKLTYLRYPVKDSDKTITVATTRPETMLGDTAVAVNGDDERYKDLVGKMVLLPLTNREIPIIADAYVDAEFGTGAVKITPAHDPNDYLVGERHNLEQRLVMNMDATMNAAAGTEFEGLDRFVAREKVVEEFEKLGLLEKVDDYEITLPVCERCKTIVEPILSEQWFVKMDELRDMGLELIKQENAPHFSPEVPHLKVYTAWLENLKDWTISRQLWWGHQIPAWYDADGNVFVGRTEEEAKEKAGGRELTQDSDVLDTWFSSGLWAFSTLGWNGDVTTTLDLETFLPTDVLVTGRDIMFLWVSRMMMLTKKFVGKTAFKDCVITGTVLGKDGKPMSKSRGNGVDPIEMFDKFGVDATRIYLASIATGADIRWNDIGVETYRNFANKIWNAARFCLMYSEASDLDWATATQEEKDKYREERGRLTLADRWIDSRAAKTAQALNRSLENYQFHEAVNLVFHFFRDDFCDWYIELRKDEIVAGNILASAHLFWVLDMALRMLHPFMPYLTEELWLKLPGSSDALHNPAYREADASIMLADFPVGNPKWFDDIAEKEMESVIELIKKVRNIRAEINISTAVKFTVHVAAHEYFQKVFAANEAQILKLAKAEKLVIGETLDVPRASAKAVTADASIAVPLEGLIDFDKERERLQNQIEKLDIELQRLNGQLSNENFVSKAPAEKVEELRDRQTEIEQQTKTLTSNLESLNV
ncbi:MAG: valine--tRNA ligase [Acidobacteriota bacterium]